MPSAAVLIIGNEVLSGKVVDENTPFLARRCRELGVDLRRVHVVPDDGPAIAEAVRALLPLVDWVFSAGGVGPTHDDVTMEGVAAGLGVAVVEDARLAGILRERLGARFTPAALRMAEVPAGSVLWWDADMAFPQVVAGRVVVFPGVPSLLRRKFDAVCHRFAGVPVRTARLRTTADEHAIADRLRAAQLAWPAVDIGSYPQFDTRPWTVTLTLDSRDLPALAACRAQLLEALAPEVEALDDGGGGPAA